MKILAPILKLCAAVIGILAIALPAIIPVGVIYGLLTN